MKSNSTLPVRYVETENLLLRPFTQEDLELVFRIYSDEEILRYTPFDTMNREEAAAHLDRITADWERRPCLSREYAVLLKESGEKIGRTHILTDPETETGMIGWFLLPEYRGRHFSREMTRALLDTCFRDLGLRRVNAVCNPDNAASRKTLAACGLRLEARLKEKCRYVKKGRVSWHDELEYAVLRSEYPGVLPASEGAAE